MGVFAEWAFLAESAFLHVGAVGCNRGAPSFPDRGRNSTLVASPVPVGECTLTRITARELVDRLGGDTATSLGLDLELDADRWLVAACLLSGRVQESIALDAWRALERAGLAFPIDLATAGPEAATRILAAAGYPKPEAAALKLARAGSALATSRAKTVRAIGDAADDFEDLGGRLARLAPGIGRATILAFLRPLREIWPAARETPLSPAAQAAAVHLGFVAPGADEEGEPGALRRALDVEDDAPPFAAVEAALAALGRSHCLRERATRCPIPEACPIAGSRIAQTGLQQ